MDVLDFNPRFPKILIPSKIEKKRFAMHNKIYQQLEILNPIGIGGGPKDPQPKRS